MGKGEKIPTVDELIATLKKSSLPTLVCEGSDDLIVYRRIEDKLSHLGLSLLPVGGRDNAIKIFERRREIAAVPLAFIVDRDTWINTGVPAQYTDPSIILTDGYSIENDAFRDGNFLALLIGPESATFHSEISDFIEWYALALSRHLIDQSQPISLHPEQVLNASQRPALLALKNGEAYPTTFRTTITNDYKKLLRGKSLLNLLSRNLNTRKNLPNHSTQSLLEFAAANPGPLLTATTNAVKARFEFGVKSQI
ncbi:hypothetical protein ACG04R_23155 [Roseateles sp. BYS78W]|uniref:DUF4435 domain-containing protein n=1 Tax=Pelomonas candidula TaxID=3299025 RepID=A0ABW7HIK8_9BURK